MKRLIRSSSTQNGYEVVGEGSEWYVVRQDNIDDVVSGPFFTEDEAEEEALALGGSKVYPNSMYIEWFNRYCRNIRGMFFQNGKACNRSRKILESAVQSFNTKNNCNLRVVSDSDSESNYFTVA